MKNVSTLGWISKKKVTGSLEAIKGSDSASFKSLTSCSGLLWRLIRLLRDDMLKIYSIIRIARMKTTSYEIPSMVERENLPLKCSLWMQVC